jgi:hypothetical protein
MGGGGQSNSQQAATAATQQTQANAQDMAISKQNADLQKRMTDTLFGSGAPGSRGTLSGMLDPASLTQKGLNPAYTTQFNQGSDQLGKDYAAQRGALAQSFANSGATSSSTPTGFQADQMRKLDSSTADSRGQLYSDLVGKQYGDTLSNFWNANNIASGNAATSGSTATNAAGNSGSSSAQIYGTAGQYHPSQFGSIVGSALGAGGQVGAAAMGKPPKPGCWIAEAIYGFDDPRTVLLRLWLNTEFTKKWVGRFVMTIYVAIGRQTAWAVRRSRVLRAAMVPLFEHALRHARAWETRNSNRSGFGTFDAKGEIDG